MCRLGVIDSGLRNTRKGHIKVKREVRPGTGHEEPKREKSNSSTLSLTSALDGGGWLTLHPVRFTHGKGTRYPFYRRLGGPQVRSGRVWKISPLPGFDPLSP